MGLPVTASATQNEVLPWKAKALFKPVPATVLPAEPLPGRMAIGGPVPASVDAQQGAPPVAPGTTASPQRTEIAALETAPLDAATGEPPVTAAPKAERGRAAAGARVVITARRFAGERSAAGPKLPSEGPGTPRHNLLMALAASTEWR